MTREAVYDVIVAGLGPVGATLAALLGRADLSVLAIDMLPDVHPLPRAAHIDHEIMRLLQSLGLTEAIAPHVREAPDYEFRTAGGERLRCIRRAGVRGISGWATSYNIYQPGIEAELRLALSKMPSVTTMLGATLGDILRNGADGVSVTIASGESTRAIDARFLVGCDGAASTVRQTLGIHLDDYDFDEPWLVVDGRVNDESRFPVSNLQICDPRRPTSFVHMGPGRLRWEFMLKPEEAGQQPADLPPPETLLAPWSAMGSIEVERTAVYRFHALVARRWRDGGVFLAGDAAHQMPPFMGQGMCSGLRDAANLAWKLERAIRGAGDQTVLDSYQSEREPHVRFIIERAIEMGRVVCTLDPAAAARRDAEMLASPADATPAAFPPLTGGWVLPNSAGAGEIFPQPVTAEGERLDDRLGPGAWLLTLGRTPTDPGRGVRAFSLEDDVPETLAAPLRLWLRERGVAAVLVRPDRYVFGSGDARDLVDRYLASAPREPNTVPRESGVHFSHFGLFVHDLAGMERFYVELLDFTVTDRGELSRAGAKRSIVFLSRDPEEHHQIVLASGRPETLDFNPINQISMRVESLAELRVFYRRFRAAGRLGLDPVSHGNAVSFYAPDPEGNRLEIYWNTPWYVSQPLVEPIDLDLPDETLLPRLERTARDLPGFRSREAWSAEMRERMAIVDSTKRTRA